MIVRMATVTITKCNECGKQLRLPHEDEDHEPIELTDGALRIAEKLARLLVCDDCKGRFDRDLDARTEREDSERRVGQSGLPAALRGLAWGDLVQTGSRARAISGALTWANAPSSEARGLYLWGPTGTGKTRLAATAAWHRITERGQPLRWVSVAVLLARLEGSWADQDRQNSLAVLTGDGPLVLDDIDKVNPSESKRAQLFAAIDRRIVTGVPLLVTGNLSPLKLEHKLGDAIASRLLGYCLGRTFQMDGPDRRMNLDL